MFAEAAVATPSLSVIQNRRGGVGNRESPKKFGVAANGSHSARNGPPNGNLSRRDGGAPASRPRDVPLLKFALKEAQGNQWAKKPAMCRPA